MLLQLGEAPEAVRGAHGGYGYWFEQAWDGPLALVDGRRGGPLPRPRDYAGVVVSGSSASLAEAPLPGWMDDAADLVRRALDDGTPLLGICFGHQLIGYAFGGRVVANPLGWEMGSLRVAITDEGQKDPLFQGLGASIRVNLTHRDMIDPAANRLPVLATNDATAVQAVAVGEHIRGIQFHPEITGAAERGYIEARRSLLTGQDPDALLAEATDCPDGIAVMRNFRRGLVEKA